MNWEKMRNCFIDFVIIITLVLIPTACTQVDEKIGILFISGGIEEHYGLHWRVQFYDHLFPAWPKGFLAGGPKEGETCYTLLHYANEAESFICGVDEGTLIDAFCNAYTGPYQVHSLYDHWVGSGDETFFTDCFPNALPMAVLTGGHNTIDPSTLEVIEGPHIDDPDGSGIGIADFVEMTSFTNMDQLYRLPDNRDPSTREDLEWFYGNDAPDFLNYEPHTPELTNIKDQLEDALPEYEFVFRHGSEAYMKNLDAYGMPTDEPIAGSTETAIQELIHDEGVDRIVVFLSAPGNANLTRFGPCWRDEDGQGISALTGKTYRECLEDLTDGYGPDTQEALDEYLTNKPWEELNKIVYPEVEHLVHETDSTVGLSFAPALGDMGDFEMAVLALLNHTIAKYSIPQTASLKVILASHGLSSGWQDVLECDCYFEKEAAIANRLINKIADSVSWTGTFTVVSGSDEFGEAENDPVSADNPFGNIWSTGEHIDDAINGTYVNELGQVVDNGTNNFDYIIAIPVSWSGDSTDTLVNGRITLGNNVKASIQGRVGYARDENDSDGTPYDAADFDSEYFTEKVYDASGWASVPGCIEDSDCEVNNEPVKKGSATKPTTVIYTGTVLSLGNSEARTSLTQAAVKTLIEAVKNPESGGYGDSCE